MIDPLLDDAIGNIFWQVFKNSVSSLVDSAKWLKAKGKEKDILGTASKQYKQKLEERYNMIRIFGMERPIPLRNIYVRVNILEKITERLRLSIKTLEKQFDLDKRGFGKVRLTRPGTKIIDTENQIIVLGKPGAGKTTFLKYLVLRSIDGKTKIKRVPIFITLKDFSDSNKPLIDFIVDQFDICNFPEAKPYIIKLFEEKKAQLLLDGLDEVPKSKENFVLTEIKNFSEKYMHNQYIVSCRIAAYNYWFNRFVDVEIADFDDKQIKLFINNWFIEDRSIAKLCWEKLNEHKQIKELASIPLLLTLFCLAFGESLEFPQNRSELYKEALDALLKKWDASKRIQRELIYKHLSLKRKESMFSRIAADTFERGEYFYPQKKLESYISNFIQHLPEANDESLEIDSEMILKAIEAQHGLFVQRAKGIYTFSHLTFQEYFTAKYIVDNSGKVILRNLVREHITDKRWREVFLLTAEMLEDADELFLLIKGYIDEMLKKTKPKQFLEKIKLKVKEDSPYPKSLNRAIAIIHHYIKPIILGIDLPIDVSVEYHSDLKLALQLAKSLCHYRSYNINFDKLFEIESANAIAIKFINMIELEKAINVDFEIECDNYCLEVYLRTNNLLIDCLNTECYVSKHIRTKILDELLTTPQN